jgi:hypothetical protein
MDLVKRLELSLVRIDKMIFLQDQFHEDRLMSMIDMLTNEELTSTFGLILDRDKYADYEIIEMILSHFSGYLLARVSTPVAVIIKSNGVRLYDWDSTISHLVVATTLADLVTRSINWANTAR